MTYRSLGKLPCDIISFTWSLCLSVDLSACLSLYVSVCLSISPFLYLCLCSVHYFWFSCSFIKFWENHAFVCTCACACFCVYCCLSCFLFFALRCWRSISSHRRMPSKAFQWRYNGIFQWSFFHEIRWRQFSRNAFNRLCAFSCSKDLEEAMLLNVLLIHTVHW